MRTIFQRNLYAHSWRTSAAARWLGLSIGILFFGSAGRIISVTSADSFGTGANAFQIDFVTIGNPGNPPDANPNPTGAAPYSYRIGKYEFPEDAINKANALGNLGITIDSRGPNKPATSVTWYEAATFVNWLDSSTGSTPAYKFDASGNFQLWLPTDSGYDAANLYRNKLSKYFLPSLSEWHKAAYYDPAAAHYWDYPTGSDDAPFPVPDGTGRGTAVYDQSFSAGPADVSTAGGPSPYGTIGQGGNVYEWEETAFDRVNNVALEQRSIDGGNWDSAANILLSSHTGIGIALGFEADSLGFRIATTVPEPRGFVLFAAGASCFASYRYRVRAQARDC